MYATHPDGKRLSFSFDLSRLQDDLPLSVYGLLANLPENGPSSKLTSLDALPVQYKLAMSRIAGVGSHELFGEKTEMATSVCNDAFKLDHLFAQYENDAVINFQLKKKDDLDPHLSSKDTVHYVKIAGPPYFVSDYNKKRPTGLMELAVTVQLVDLIWVDETYAFVGDPYWWENQYLCHILTSLEQRSGKRATLDRVLYSLPLPHNQERSYGSMVKYRDDLKGETGLVALADIDDPGVDAMLLGPDQNKHLVRPGMGVIFECTLGALMSMQSYIDAKLDPQRKYHIDGNMMNYSLIYGSVLGFADALVDDESNEVGIVIRVHLCNETTPEWLLSKMNGSFLIQTNLEVTISSRHLIATFSIWPAALFQSSCVSLNWGSFLINDRVVVGHLQISLTGEGQGLETDGGDGESFAAPAYILGPKTLEPLLQMLAGRASLELMRIKPLQPWQCLNYIHKQNELMNLCAYACPHSHLLYLRRCFEQFCRDKAQLIKTPTKQRTFHPNIPGKVLIELLYPNCTPRTTSVLVANMAISISFHDPKSLNKMFERNMAEFDYRSEGYGVVALTGPITFKWEFCTSEDGSQSAEGKVSVTVFGWADMDRFGKGTIKGCQDPTVSATNIASKKRSLVSQESLAEDSGERQHFMMVQQKLVRANAKAWKKEGNGDEESDASL